MSVSDEEIKFLFQMYEKSDYDEKIDFKAILKEFPISWKKLKKEFARLKLKTFEQRRFLERRDELFQSNQVFTDQSFFNKLNEKSFYFAGYLVGCHDKDNISGYFENKDRIVTQILTTFEFNILEPIKEISSNLIANDLIRHFYRGYLDSSGTFSYFDYKKRDYPQVKIKIYASNEFGLQLIQYLRDNLLDFFWTKSYRKLTDEDFQYIFKISHNEYCCPILEFLYENCSVFDKWNQMNALDMYCDHGNRIARQIGEGKRKIDYTRT